MSTTVRLTEVLDSLGDNFERDSFRKILAEEIDLSAGHDWDEGGRVHNWKNYISDQLQLVWLDIDPIHRALIRMEADRQADCEEWE